MCVNGETKCCNLIIIIMYLREEKKRGLIVVILLNFRMLCTCVVVFSDIYTYMVCLI